MKLISNRQNPLVRTFRALADSADNSEVRILLDGVHLVREARMAGLAFEAVAVESSHLTGASEAGALARALDSTGAPVFSVSPTAFRAMSPVRTPSGVVAIATRTPSDAGAISLTADGFTLVAANIQDPGNVGGLIRAAEAGGATGVLVAGTSANPFSWKALRGSMGSALRLPVAGGQTLDAVTRCGKAAGARTIAAIPRDGRSPDAIDWRGSLMLILGGEGPGLPPRVIADCDDAVTIPMTAPVESLNVAVAGAILIYAARRQRS